MRILILLTLSTSAIYADACTAKTGGTAASPLPWSTITNWTGCTTGGSHYPGQIGVDTVLIPAGANIAADVNVTVGNSGQPYYYYPYLTGNGGSGYPWLNMAGCGGGFTTTGTTPYRTASLFCSVVNGALQITLWDHGYYKTSTMPTLTALSWTTPLAYTPSSATNTNPVRLALLGPISTDKTQWSTGWLPGSSQVTTISGGTGSWAALNGTRTLTVISDDIRLGTVVSVAGIDSTAWGAVAGTLAFASPSVTYNAGAGSPTWVLATMTGGGTAAIQINHVSVNSGTLTLAANITLTIRGDIIINGAYPEATAVIIQKRGSHLISDNSLYVGSPKPEYGMTQAIGNAESLLYDASDCANATRAGTDMAAHTGECWISVAAGVSGVVVNWQNVFVTSGSADAPVMAVGGNNQNTLGITAYNNWFDRSGTLSNYGEFASPNTHTNLIDLQGNLFTRPLNPLPILTYSIATTGGPRKIQANYIEGALEIPVSYTTQFSGSVSGNFIGSGASFVAYPGFSFTDNILRTDPWSNGVNSFGAFTPNADHNYMWHDQDKDSNQRWIGCNGPSFGWIGHFTGFHWGDPGEIGCNLNYTLFLPDGTGFVGSRLESMVNSAAPPETFLHNTTSADSVTAGTFDASENGVNTLHPLVFKSTLIWLPTWASHQDTPGDQTWYKLTTTLTPGSVDICTTTSPTVSNCDYNSGYGSTAIQKSPPTGQCGATGSLCPNQGRSYAGSWSFTPGSHDLDAVRPYFVDETRNLLWYDIGMGAPLAAAWSNLATYHWGDKASNTYRDASTPITYYNGQRFNYACKVADCTGAPEPGRVDLWNTWRNYWIFGGQWQIMQDIYAHGNTAWQTDTRLWGHFVNGAGPHSQCTAASPCSATQAAMGWVAAGFRPRQPALQTAAHDGTTIGAMPGAPMCDSSGVGAITGSIGQGCNAVMQ